MTDMRVALVIEGESSSAKTALADTVRGIDQVKASAAGAGAASTPIAAVGAAAAGAVPQVTALGTAGQNTATAAAAMAQSSATAAAQQKQAAAAAAAAATAYAANANALRGLVETVDPAARQLRMFGEAQQVVDQAVQAGIITQERGAEVLRRYEQALSGAAPAAAANAAALRGLMETVDPTARQTRLLAEAQGVLDQAVAAGAITQQRATAVLRQYEQMLQTSGARVGAVGAQTIGATGGMGRFGMVAQAAGYQVGDFAVQVSSGQNALVAFSQQASQLLGFFGVWGAVAGAGLAIFAGLAIGLGLFEDSTKESEDALEAHQKQLDDWVKSAQKADAGAATLAIRFGELTAAQRETVRQDLQRQIDEQIAGLKVAAETAMQAIRDSNAAYTRESQQLDMTTGRYVTIPARLQLDADIKVPADLRQKLLATLQPLFEGDRSAGYLSGLYKQLNDLADQAEGPARTMIAGWAKVFAGMSAGAELGADKVAVLEAKMRILNGTAREGDRELVTAAEAADKLGRNAGGAADMVDRLIGSIDRFLGMKPGTGFASQAESWGGQFVQAFQALQGQAEIQRLIDASNADAEASAGGQAAQRARQRQKAIEAARQQATSIVERTPGLPNGQGMIDQAGIAAATAFDAQQAAIDAKTAARQDKQKDAYEREIERVRKATDETKTQAGAIGLTSRAAAELTTQQGLLYAAQQAGLTVDQKRLVEIKATAAAYAEQTERLKELQSQDRQRQRLAGLTVGLVDSTATPDEARAREMAQLRRQQAQLAAGDPDLMRQLQESGLTAADAATALQRRIGELSAPDLLAGIRESKGAFREFFTELRSGSVEAGQALQNLGLHLLDIAQEKLVDEPLGRLFDSAVDGLFSGAAGTANDNGKTGGKPGEAANDNAGKGILGAAASALGLTSDKDSAAISVGTATITVSNAAGGLPGLGGLLGGTPGAAPGGTPGLIPDRPDVIGELAKGLTGGTGATTLPGGAGADTLTASIGDALGTVAEGIKTEGAGFLGSFGQGLSGLVGGLGGVFGSIFDGLGSLLGGGAGGGLLGGGSGGGLGSLLGLATSFLGFGRGGAIGAGGDIHALAAGSSVRRGALIDTPTLFPLAAGGMAIVREELRNEAILPTMHDGRAVQGRDRDGRVMPLSLTRLPSGDLGVVLPEPPVPYARGGVPGLDIPAAPPSGFGSGSQAGSASAGAGGALRSGDTWYIDARGSDIGVETRLQRVMQRTVPQTIKGSDRYAQDQDERISARRRGRRG